MLERRFSAALSAAFKNGPASAGGTSISSALGQYSTALMSSMIRMALEDGESPIELLQQHDARQFMRQRHLPEGQNVRRGGSRGVTPAIGRPDGEQQLLGVVRLVILEKVGNLFRSELAPRASSSTSTDRKS